MIAKLFILALAATSINAFAKPTCDSYLRADVSMQTETRMTDEEVIRLEDTVDRRFFAYGYARKGQMTFNIVTQVEGAQSKSLIESEAFAFLVNQFGPKINSVRAVWRWGQSHEEFNKLTAAGIDPDTAVKMTTEGRLALANGFGRIEIEMLNGTPGHYRDANVVFSKP